MRTLASAYLLAFGCAYLSAPIIAQAATDESGGGPSMAYVQVRDTKLRSQPKIWAPAVSSLKYGAPLEIIEPGEGWVKVKPGKGNPGYVHVSAITSKKVVLNSANAPKSTLADTSDVVLAGKGFSKEVEKEFALTNPSMNFSAVDQFERTNTPEGELVRFRDSGLLSKEG